MKIIRNTLTINSECLMRMMKLVGYGKGWHFYPLHKETVDTFLFSGDISWLSKRKFVKTLKVFGARGEILFIDEEEVCGGNIFGYRFNGGNNPERLCGDYNICVVKKNKKKNYIKDRLMAI